jgi:hypothetical protein
MAKVVYIGNHFNTEDPEWKADRARRSARLDTGFADRLTQPVGSCARLKIYPSGDYTAAFSAPPIHTRRKVVRARPTEHPLAGIDVGFGCYVYQNRQPIHRKTIEGQTQLCLLLEKLYEQALDECKLDKADWYFAQWRDVIDWLATATPTEKVCKRRGTHGISSYGKRMVRSGCVLLEEAHPKQLAFFTATLPNLPREDMVRVCTEWSNIIRKFNQELTRELKRKGLDARIVGVTEIQEKRYRQTGQAVPHLHLVFHGRLEGQHWAISPKWFRLKWERVVSESLGCEIELPAATRVEKLKKSAAGYLSKYMSKGGQALKKIAGDENQPCPLPTGWWHMSDGLRRDVRQGIRVIPLSRIDLEGLLLDVFPQAIDNLWVNCFCEPTGGRLLAVYGRCRASQRERFLSYVLQSRFLAVARERVLRDRYA